LKSKETNYIKKFTIFITLYLIYAKIFFLFLSTPLIFRYFISVLNTQGFILVPIV